ncbi:MAG: SUMF1/EgtB/PvdO family nonheme iron enzyme [Thermodesulfobacteriota bacterium]|nr:SUMF1/EgtB/PvdO family nonheme iron enzyme [Thermodesulfobacteriota bacterium]
MRCSSSKPWALKFYVMIALFFAVILSTAFFPIVSQASQSKGIQVVIKDSSGRKVGLYKGSYALVIGASRYTKGWPNLESIPGEIDRIQDVLKNQGFHVEKVLDPTGDKLSAAFENFIDRYGFDRDNRLFFFFSGHGYTRKQGKKGYLVPVDAPDPRYNEKGFLQKAIGMAQVMTWAKKIEAKHAIFMFDSCFSGTIFRVRALPKIPPHISDMTSHPVRQFISAGSAGEQVPSKSVFTPSFIRALKGQADLDRDGYVTGTELGMYLHRKVLSYETGQTPQYGKIKDPDLDEGDFVFIAGGSAVGTLHVETKPSGATVWIDGKRKGGAPIMVRNLAPGRIKVRASREGYTSQEEHVYIRAGRETKLTLILDPIITKGSLGVNSEPSDAKWYLNGAYVGTTPGAMTNLDQSTYDVEVKKKGYKDWSKKNAEIKSGEKTVLNAILEELKQGPDPGEVGKEPTTGMEFVWVPGGCFDMDCGRWADDCNSNEKPLHEVCLDGFGIGRYEVTQGQWKKVMGGNPSRFKRGDNYPVERVSWDDAKDFIRKFTSMNNGRYAFRLPTEAEWEYACRSGGRNEKYSGGGDVDQVAWYINNSESSTHPVGTKAPNNLGIYDMSGNVWEWCEDWYDMDYYKKSHKHNPKGPSNGKYRVFRGGSYYGFAGYERCDYRNCDYPVVQHVDLGFRLVVVSSQ